MTFGTSLPLVRGPLSKGWLLLGLLIWTGGVGPAGASVTQISGLSDVTFNSLNPALSASSSQSICVYSDSFKYAITASGSGSNSAFTLSAGGSIPPLPYSVLWSPSPSQTTGTALTASVPLTGQATLATGLTCLIGIGDSASVTVSLAASDLQGALSGVTYTGVLTLLVSAQ